jgi:hypothetical protein
MTILEQTNDLLGIMPYRFVRLIIAVYILRGMIETGGSKDDKVRAAFDYADLILKG